MEKYFVKYWLSRLNRNPLDLLMLDSHFSLNTIKIDSDNERYVILFLTAEQEDKIKAEYNCKTVEEGIGRHIISLSLNAASAEDLQNVFVYYELSVLHVFIEKENISYSDVPKMRLEDTYFSFDVKGLEFDGIISRIRKKESSPQSEVASTSCAEFPSSEFFTADTGRHWNGHKHV